MRTMLANTHRWWQLPTGLAGAVHRLPAGLQDKVSTAADMLWTQELNRCDLLLAHFGGNGLRLARAKKRSRLAPPIVTIFHGNDVGIPAHDGTLARYLPLFQHGAHQLTVNDVFRRALIEAGAPERQVSVHRMGIDCDDIAYRPREIGQGPLQLISVCRLVEKKGIAFALRAVAALQAARPDHRLALLDSRRRTVARCACAALPRSLASRTGSSFAAPSRTAASRTSSPARMSSCFRA